MASAPRFFVTAASGQLGRLVVAALVERADPSSVVAIVRNPTAAASLFPTGVEVREGDYSDTATLDAAFAGAERLLLISSNALGERVTQHRNAIEAAVRAGVGRIVYTSVLHADISKLGLAEEHRQTEAMLEASGTAFTILRNGWYSENHAASIPSAIEHGAFLGSAGSGRVSSAARIDFAEAAAIALLDNAAPAAGVLELAGDESYTLTEFAAEISRQAAKAIPYRDLLESEYRAALEHAGLPVPLAALLADSDAAAADGALFNESKELSRLIGRPTTPLSATIAQTLRS